MLKKKSMSRPKKMALILLFSAIVFISPFIIIPLFLWLFNLVTPDVPTKEVKDITVIISEYGFELNEYINYFILFLQLISTAVFSYILWETSVKSNELAERIDEKDDNREKELVRENALIVFYDLTLGLKDLAKLYESRIIKKTDPNPKRMFFSNDWIKNVAFLKDKLTNNEISVLYSLYGDLLILKDLLESDDKVYNYRNLDEEVKKLFTNLMNANVIDYAYAFDLNIFDVLSYVSNRKFYIMEKLRLLTFKEKQIVKKRIKDKIFQVYIDNVLYYEGEMEEDKFHGKGIIWYKNLMGKTYKRFDGRFVSGLFMEGVRQEEHAVDQTFFKMQFTRSNVRVSGQVYDKDGKILANGKYDDDGNPQEGFFIFYNDDGKIKYDGNVKNKEYHGDGTFYENKTVKTGIWENGELIEGKSIHEKVNGPLKFKDNIKGIEFADFEYKNGEKKIIEESRKIVSLI